MGTVKIKSILTFYKQTLSTRAICAKCTICARQIGVDGVKLKMIAQNVDMSDTVTISLSVYPGL